MGKGFTACASSGKGNLKAINCRSLLSTSLEALFLVWAGCGLIGQYEHEQEGGSPLRACVELEFT